MRTTGLGLLVTVALLISGCSPAERDGAVNVYKRNESPASLGLRIDDQPVFGGSWHLLEDGTSCTAVSVPWTISIGAADRDGAVGDYRGLLSSADVSDPTNAEVWIDVAEDGSVSWGEGRPDWDRGGPGDCG